MQVTITFRPVACGTEVQIVQEGLPAALPVEFCHLGWQESLTLLAHVVEPDIPDAVKQPDKGLAAVGRTPSRSRKSTDLSHSCARGAIATEEELIAP